MSGPVKPWRESKDLEGAERRAAELFQKALPPREASPAVEARHLAVLRGDAPAPRRFRLSTPAAVAVFFGASMAFAATQPNVRAWARERLERIGVLAPAPKPVAVAPRVEAPAPAPLPAPVEPTPPVAAEPERVMAMEGLDVSDAGPKAVAQVARPAAKAPKPPTVAKAAAKQASPKPAEEDDVIAPPVVPAASAATDDARAAAQKPATGGVLSGEDLPELSRLSTAERAEVLLKRGDLEEAGELLNAEKADHSDRMNLVRGELLRARGLCPQANVFFSSVIQTAGLPSALYERAYFGRAKCFEAVGNAKAAEGDIAKYRAMFPRGRL